jgi:hypothetical protein
MYFILHSYFLGNSNHVRAYNTIIDLSFKCITSLNSKPHIEMTYWKTFKVLDFIMRTASDFKLKLVIKILFCVLVRFILEYDSII